MAPEAGRAALDHSGFDFPLNVYAHLLALRYGRPTGLHYGLFATPETDVQEAQERSTRSLLEAMLPPPAKVLEVGIGLGLTFSRLQEAGYEVLGITPDAAQIANAQPLAGANGRLQCVAYETLDIPAASVDVVVFQESAQYVDLLTLFERAARWLRPGGQLLILDEVALRRVAPGAESLHLAKDVLALAERIGFRLDRHDDYSAQAAPTLDYLLADTQARREVLMHDLGVSAADLDGLQASNVAYLEKYRSGRYGYMLFDFRRPEALAADIGWARHADEADLLGLFAESFGYAMDPAVWRWKYAEAEPLGTVVRRDGKLQAFYGGMPRQILFHGAPAQAVQIGDVMVHPRERGILRRNGPFLQAASTFLERCVGFGRPCLLGFGFPTDKAMRLADRLGLYREADRMLELSWPATPGTLSPLAVRGRPLDPERDGPTVDFLWQRMAGDLCRRIVGVRDWARIRYRYLGHPGVRYETFLLRHRLTRRPLGVVVLREREDALELVDVVAPLSCLPQMVAFCRRHAQRCGKARVFVWVAAAAAAAFRTKGVTETPLGLVVPTCAWTSGPAEDEVRGQWWLLGGDSDFR